MKTRKEPAVSEDPSANDLRGLREDLERLLDERLTERVKTQPGAEHAQSAPTSARPAEGPPVPAPRVSEPAGGGPTAPKAPSVGVPVQPDKESKVESALPTPVRSAGSAPNPGGPRSSIGRRRLVASVHSQVQADERVQELEQEVLRLRLRAETAEEALLEAERLFAETTKGLQARLRVLEAGSAGGQAAPEGAGKRWLARVRSR